jgi:flavodoxin
MNIGIIVFSQSGHTLSVAEKLQERLNQLSHPVQIDAITIEGEAAPDKFQLTHQPDVSGYDALIFASPVQAFSLNPVMQAYLNGLPSLENKPTAYLVTKQLPFNWTGGNRAIKTMQSICQKKGARILGSAIVVWQDARRDDTTEKAVTLLSQLFSDR